MLFRSTFALGMFVGGGIRSGESLRTMRLGTLFVNVATGDDVGATTAGFRFAPRRTAKVGSGITGDSSGRSLATLSKDGVLHSTTIVVGN